MSELFIVKSEYEVEDGYVDIALFKRGEQEIKYEALIEIKYIKKGDFEKKGESIIEENLLKAREQMVKYGGAKEFKKKSLMKWVIIFVGTKAYVVERIHG